MKTFLQILLLSVVLTCLTFEVKAAGPTVSTGYDSTAILKAGVRLKSFNNGPGGEIYLGKPDLGVGANRVELDFGYTGQWQASNHVKFEYTPADSNNLKVTVNANNQDILTYNLGDAGRLNYLQIDVVGRQAGTTVDFNNVTLNGNVLGNFSGTGGWHTWQVKELDFTSNFTVEGDLLLAGTQPGGETNKLQLSAGYVRPVIVWVSLTYTPSGPNDGHTWGYDAFNNIKEGIDSVATSGTVIVGDGSYNEDVVLNKSLKLYSVNGRAATIVNGQTAGWGGGALRINSSKVTVGGNGKGFTFNSKTSGGTPLFSCYVSGARDSLWIEENKFVAAPRNPGNIETYALLTDGGQTNQTYQNNIFDGMATPRFLVYVNGLADRTPASMNIDFVGNTFTTLAGGLTLSSSGGEVSGNYFQGTAGIGLNTSSSNVISGNFFQGIGNHFTNHISSGVDVDAVIGSNTFDRRVVIRNAGAYRTETFPWGTFVIVRGNIQGAIDAASAGDSVLVAEGTYNETVQIRKGLTLAGVGRTQTIIQPTGGLTTGKGHKYDANMSVGMLVDSTVNVTVRDMTIDGNEVGLNAVVFWNSSSGTLENLKVMRPMVFSGMQTGQGLAVDATTPGSVSLNVNNCEFEQWNKNAIDIVNGNGTTSNGGNITFTVSGGTFTGRGNTATTAQNCIVVWERGGGTINGSIQNASFANVNYTPTSNEASAILQYGSPNGTISPITGCSFTNTEVYVGEAGGSNHNIIITGNVFDGVNPAYATIAQLAAIEDKIIHKMDDNTSGLITFRLKNVVATPMNLGIQQGINAASPGDTVLVAAGTYRDSAYSYVDIIINKSINLIGTGSASTIVELHESNNPPGSHMDGVSIGASDVLIQDMKFTKLPTAPYATGFNIRAGVNVALPPPGNTFSNIVLRDVESEYSQGMNVCFNGSYVYQNVVIENCNFHHGGERNFYESPNTTINYLTVTNSHFDNCGQQLGGDPIGFNLQGTTTNLNMTGGTFNENINGGIVFRNVSGAIINGVTVQHSGYKSTGDRSGIGIWEDVATTSNVQIINPTVTNCGGRGVMFGTWGKTVSNVTLAGGTISGSGNNGVMLYGGGSGGALSNIACDSVTITTSGTNNYQAWADAGTNFSDIQITKCSVTTPTAGNNIYIGAAAGASYSGTNSITDCNIAHAPPSFRGIRIYDQSGINIAIHKNKISGNGYGILAQTSVLQDAKENWWGHASGPADPKTLPNTPNYNNPTGLGDSVSSYVDYRPWYADSTMDTLAQYTIVATAGSHGSINPTGSIVVYHGTDVSFTFHPDPTYHVDSVFVDNIYVPDSLTGYTFRNVTGPHTITVHFSINQVQITIQTNPAGRAFEFDGITYTTPRSERWT